MRTDLVCKLLALLRRNLLPLYQIHFVGDKKSCNLILPIIKLLNLLRPVPCPLQTLTICDIVDDDGSIRLLEIQQIQRIEFLLSGRVP